MHFANFPIDYQKLFHTLTESYLLIGPDPDATILDNTDSHVVASLKKREDVVGKAFFEAYPAPNEEAEKLVRTSHEHVRRHLEPHTMDLIRYDLERPAEQGGGLQEMYWQATHYPLLDAEGKLEYILQRAHDVTEQYLARQYAQQIEQELEETNKRIDFIMESLPVLVWTATVNGSRTYFNQRWVAFTGKTESQLSGNQWMDCLHPEDQDRVRATWYRSVAEGKVYEAEYRLRRHDGHYRWVLFRAVPRLNTAGQITMWVGSGTDIHDQKVLVEELLVANETQAALAAQTYQAHQLTKSQRSMFYDLFMQVPALICILRGPEHRFDFVNPPFQQLFHNRQLLGQNLEAALPDFVEQGVLPLLDTVYITGEPFHGIELPYMVDPANGQPPYQGYFNFTYKLFSENGVKAGIMVFANDVTILVQARKALEKPGDVTPSDASQSTTPAA